MDILITNATLLTLSGSDRPRAGQELGHLGVVRKGALFGQLGMGAEEL